MRDRDIRKNLVRNLAKRFGTDALIVEEMVLSTVGGSRIDVAVLNGFLHGYEIKSDVDSLRRLPLQTESYGAIFDYLTVVASERHIEKCFKIIPEYWGVFSATRATPRHGIQLAEIRKATPNTAVGVEQLIRILRRSEMESLLSGSGFSGNLRSMKCYELDALAMRALTVETIQNHVRRSLKMRADWQPAPAPC